MIQRAVVYFCLLFLCIGMPIQAGTLSGDGVSAGQTKVTAQVAAADGTLPGEGAGSGVDVNEGISTDDPSQAGSLPHVEDTAGGASRAEGLREAVSSGDTVLSIVFGAVFVMSGIVMIILIRRRL